MIGFVLATTVVGFQKTPWRALEESMRTIGPWPHAKGENCGAWKEPVEPDGGAVQDGFCPQGKLGPLLKQVGAEEVAEVEGMGDPSPRSASAARVARDVPTVGDPFPTRWAVVVRLPSSIAKSSNFVVESSFDLTLDVKGDFVEGAPLEFVVTQ